MATLDIRGHKLEYTELGEGDTVLFVHGSQSDYRTWHHQQEAVSLYFRTISYSRRYHWPNEAIADGVDYSMIEQLDDLRDVVESVADKPVHLVGHSYGALLALLLAIDAPQLVRSMVLAEAPVLTLFVHIPPKPTELVKLLARRPRTGIAIIQFAIRGTGPATAAFKRNDLEAGIRHFGTAVLGRERFAWLSPERMDQVQANTFKEELLGSGFVQLSEADVRRVDVPTLLLNGEQSLRLFHRLNDRLEEILPNAARAIIPDASHIMHEDNVSDYNASVLAFLEKVRQ
jgi:pimeloyl-ACP methyl ester carboxylesterase